jgi:hypothetical protein
VEERGGGADDGCGGTDEDCLPSQRQERAT